MANKVITASPSREREAPRVLVAGSNPFDDGGVSTEVSPPVDNGYDELPGISGLGFPNILKPDEKNPPR